MKKLYELFNKIDLDINEFQEVEVTEIERAQYKKDFQKQLLKKSPQKWKRGIVAACASVSIATASLVGLSQASFANEIPLFNSLFELFSDKELVKGYDEVAQQHQLTAENHGIKITLNQVVFDSKSLFLTYQIESKENLGDTPELYGFPIINGKDYSFFSTKHNIKKIDDNQYVGLTISTLPYGDSLTEGDVNFNIEKLITNGGANEIQGNWNFSFPAVSTNNHMQMVNKIIGNNNLGINLEKIIYTPMSFIINYTEIVYNPDLLNNWDFILSGIRVKDDLGNEYEQKMNGGAENYFMYTFEELHSNAKNLIITPYFELMKADGQDEFGAKYRNNDSTSPKEVIELDEIFVEINNK